MIKAEKDAETPALFARRIGLVPFIRGTASVRYMTMTWDQVLVLACARYHTVNATVKVKKWKSTR